MDMLEARPTPPRRLRKTDPKDNSVRSKVYTQYTPLYVDPKFKLGGESSSESCFLEAIGDTSILARLSGDEQQHQLQEVVVTDQTSSLEALDTAENDLHAEVAFRPAFEEAKSGQCEQGQSYYLDENTSVNLGVLSLESKDINTSIVFHDRRSDSSASFDLQRVLRGSVLGGLSIIFCLPQLGPPEDFRLYPKKRGTLYLRHPVIKYADFKEASFVLPYFQRLSNGDKSISAFDTYVRFDTDNGTVYYGVDIVDGFHKLIEADEKLTEEEVGVSIVNEFNVSMDQSKSQIYKIDEGFHHQIQDEQLNQNTAENTNQDFCSFPQAEKQMIFPNNDLVFCDDSIPNYALTSEGGTVRNVSVKFVLDPIGGFIVQSVDSVEPQQIIISQDDGVYSSSPNYMSNEDWSSLQSSESSVESSATNHPYSDSTAKAVSNLLNEDAVNVVSQSSPPVCSVSGDSEIANSNINHHIESNHLDAQKIVDFHPRGIVENTPVLIRNVNNPVTTKELIPSSASSVNIVNNNVSPKIAVRPETGDIVFLNSINKPIALVNVPYSRPKEIHVETNHKPMYVPTVPSKCSQQFSESSNSSSIVNGKSLSPATYKQVLLLPANTASNDSLNNAVISADNKDTNCVSVSAKCDVTSDVAIQNVAAPEGQETTFKRQQPRPRNKLGYVIVCRYCGMTSSDLHNCERCKRPFPDDAKLQEDNFKPVDKNTHLAATTVGLGPNNLPIPVNPLANVKRTPGGGKKPKPSESSLIKKVRVRKTEEIVLLSSDDDEDQPKAKIMKKDVDNCGKISSSCSPIKFNSVDTEALPPGITKHVQVSLVKLPSSPSASHVSAAHEQQLPNKRPQVMLTPGASLNCGSADKEKGSFSGMTPEQVIQKLENLDQISTGTGTFTHIYCSNFRVGDYKWTIQSNTGKVSVSTMGLFFEMPHAVTKDKMVKIGIPLDVVLSTVAHFTHRLPCIFLKTGPKYATWIRNALGLNRNSDEGNFYCPINGAECQRYIAFQTIAAGHDLTYNLFRKIFTNTINELDYAQANSLVVQFKCPGHEVKETSESSSSSSLTVSEALTRSSVNGKESAVVTTTKTNSSKSARIVAKKEQEEQDDTAEQPAVDINDNRKILSYQLITINQLDIMCLMPEQFLNDSILDFWMRFMEHEMLSPKDKARTYMFSTFFYKRLTTTPKKRGGAQEEDSLSRAEKRHARVKRWTKKVDIFSKDFVFVPINENHHWFLAVICYPGMIGAHHMITGEALPEYDKLKTEKARTKLLERVIEPPEIPSSTQNYSYESSSVDSQKSSVDLKSTQTLSTPKSAKAICKTSRTPIKQPCILIFDSLAGESRSRIFSTLREYLTIEYKTRKGQDREFSKTTMQGIMPTVPQQPNHCDCGIFVLFYVQCFFSHPIPSFDVALKDLMVQEWFNVPWCGMREQIYNLLKNLASKENPASTSLIPKLSFPRPKKKAKVPENIVGETVTLERLRPEDEPMDVDVGDASLEKSRKCMNTRKLISSSSSSQSTFEDGLHDVNRTSDHDHDYVSTPDKRMRQT